MDQDSLGVACVSADRRARRDRAFSIEDRAGGRRLSSPPAPLVASGVLHLPPGRQLEACGHRFLPARAQNLTAGSPKGGTVVQLSGAVVLVTGASGGIGRATAQLAARRGATVVCAGRDAAAVQETAAGCGGATLIADLASVEGSAALVEDVLRACGRLDAVVANAGVGHAGAVVDMTPERVAELVDVDVRAPLLLARHALAAFRSQAAMGSRRTRGLVFVTSIAGLVGVPGESVYSACKAAVESFAVLLREELRDDPALTDVQVSTVAPGVVDTAFFSRRGVPYDRHFPRPIRAERAAAVVVSALETGRPRTVVPRWLAVPARLSAAAPGIYRALARRMS
jgi:short-subunit dehydrogenase